ncbi:hypothetical protein CH76_11480 [Lysinibacillus sp. BF-4]|uniref:ribonuclease H1 domain-containing protein n=1 Tax=Lysinibacillus sp. BF-4 TaxID=1473546 RepID=UPI0005063546|nr:ribonuclease H family protein [Lysinibacillus sp. BF-4]KFL42585.1 hypothetical protein CH76_11480 [Lysinibacillus sp. BF-4]
MAKFYAVRVGRTPGVYTTWAACTEQVKGFSGAVYKSFTTKQEAEAFIEGAKPQQEMTNASIEALVNELDDSTMIAFVDGSYAKEHRYYGYGAILLTNAGMQERHDSGNDERYVESRNVAGEIEGVKAAITVAVEQGYQHVHIFYDYAGIEKWAVGDWRANKPVSQHYVQFINEVSPKIRITFTKVAAHTGILYNELADELAKRAIAER